MIYRGTYGRKIPLNASCMILWWGKNRRPYQLFVSSPNEFLDVQRRMLASKISMVTYWSGRTSDVFEQPIEVDNEDMQPPDQPQQSMQPPLTPPIGGLNVPVPDSPCKTQMPGSPKLPHDPPPPSRPPAGTPVQAYGTRNTALVTTGINDSRSATSTLATASSADHCTSVE